MSIKAALSFLLFFLLSELSAQAPELIVTGAVIESMDIRYAGATAIALGQGRILALGSDEEMLALAGDETRQLAAEGAFLMPGFIDSHAHLVGLGQSLRTLDLRGTKSFAAIVERVQAAASERQKGAWIIGRGWDQNLWDETNFPDHEALSQAVPNHPVILVRIDGHALIANALAMKIAGVHQKTESPEGGEIIRRPDGSPTGVFIDRAEGLIQKHAPKVDVADLEQALLLAQEACFATGVTSFHDAGISPESSLLLSRLYAEDKLKLRVYGMWSVPDVATAEAVAKNPPLIGAFDQRLSIRAFKIYADGALGSRGAALIEDYADRPGHRGLLITPAEQLRAISEVAIHNGYQACVHAIGDRANRMILDVWEDLLRAESRKLDNRFRIEHAQVIHEDDIPRFAKLGVIASMQAVHCTSDGAWVPRRIAAQRAELGAYAWRSLLASGAVICNGTDAPVEEISAFATLYAAVTRRATTGESPLPFFPEQRMTRMEALQSCTVAGAYAAFEENEKGRLAPGLLADFILVDRDLRSCKDQELLEAQVIATFVAGEEVYRRQN